MGFYRKWRPNATQRAEYRQKMQEKEQLGVYTTPYPIRTGCHVTFYCISKGCEVSGYVVNHSYGADRGQHTFTIDWMGDKVLVKGRNLYPNIIQHLRGEESYRASL